ncbi:MAG: flippase [Patescibacteria group bacterium]|nr:flippase [Patescibacteria group bacterium]
MKIIRLVAKNTFYQIIAKIFTAGGALFGTVLITRFLGAETFGEYSIVTAFVLSFYLLSDLGINAITVKEFSQNEESIKNNFTSILIFRIVLGVILVGLCNFVLIFFPYSPVIKNAIRIGSILIFFQSIYTTCLIVFQSKLIYRYVAVISILASLLSVGILLPVVLARGSIILVISAVVVGYSFHPLIAILFLKRYLKFNKKAINVPYWRKVFILSFPLGIALILNSFMVQADRIILSVMSDTVSVGVYNLAYKVFDFVLVIPTFFMNAMFPLMIKAKADKDDKVNALLKKSLLILFLGAIFLTIFSFVSSRFLISAIWGNDMVLSFIPFNILMAGSVFFFLSSPLTWVLVVRNKQKVLPFLYGFALIFNIVLNIIFIPQYNYLASAVITVLTEFLVLLALVFIWGLTRPRRIRPL